MINRKLILFVGIVFIVLQSCNFSKTELREVNFKPKMKEVADKYKKQLAPEMFHTSSGWFRFDTVTTHKVIVTILNSGKLPKEFEEKKKLALDIASDVYSQIENKNDFSKVEVIFQNQSGAVMKIKINYPFSYEEIEKYIDNNRTVEE